MRHRLPGGNVVGHVLALEAWDEEADVQNATPNLHNTMCGKGPVAGRDGMLAATSARQQVTLIKYATPVIRRTVNRDGWGWATGRWSS